MTDNTKSIGRIINSIVEENMPLTFAKLPGMLVEAAQRGYNLRAIEEWENDRI